MSSRDSFNSVGVFLLFLVIASCQSIPPSTDGIQQNATPDLRAQPNIVFIFADDIGFGDIGANGNTVFQTPNIDSLAATGTNFQQFTVASPVCSPSRAAVLTGQFPDRNLIFQHFHTTEHHQRNGMPDWLDPSAQSIAKILQSSGYTTGHFGKWHLTNSHIPDAPEPAEYGFDDYSVFNGPGPQTDAVRVFADALQFIDENQHQPFFLNLWIHETHTPHYPDPAQIDQFSHLDERQQMYAATMASADAGVGEIMERLSQLGLTQRTIVIFSSDNGPELNGTEAQRYLRTDPDAAVPGREPLGRYFSVGETGGLRGRKRDLFEGGVRVPFLVSWPGIVPAGKLDNSTVINAVDLLPTFAAIAGVEIDASFRLDGENMLPALEGRSVARSKPIFWQRLGPFKEDGSERVSIWSAVRDGDWKYFQSTDAEDMLFHIPSDVAEENNVADEYPELVEKLKALVADWQSSIDPSVPDSAKSAHRRKPN